MITSSKELFSILKDRDYPTILFLLLFLASVAAAALNMLKPADAGLLFMACLLSRLLYIYKASLKVDELSKDIRKYIENERKTAGFTSASLSPYLNANYPRLSQNVKTRCLSRFVESMDVELLPAGDYVFYATKVYEQPGKDRRKGLSSAHKTVAVS